MCMWSVIYVFNVQLFFRFDDFNVVPLSVMKSAMQIKCIIIILLRLLPFT